MRANSPEIKMQIRMQIWSRPPMIMSKRRRLWIFNSANTNMNYRRRRANSPVQKCPRLRICAKIPAIRRGAMCCGGLAKWGFWASIFQKTSAGWGLAILKHFWCWRNSRKYHRLRRFHYLRPMSGRCTRLFILRRKPCSEKLCPRFAVAIWCWRFRCPNRRLAAR